MVKLTEDMVIARAKTSDMESITKLNFWGSDLTDVFLVRQFKRAVILSFSLNMISTLADFQFCVCLCELYIRRNNIQNLREVCYLQELPNLKQLLMSENPCCDNERYRPTVLRALPHLEILDNQEVTPLELEYALQLGLILEHPRKEREKPIIPGTEYYEGPPEDKSSSNYSNRMYEDMVRQRTSNCHKNSSSIRIFGNQDTSFNSFKMSSNNQDPLETIPKTIPFTNRRPVTATQLTTPVQTGTGHLHQDHDLNFSCRNKNMSIGHSVSDYRSLINQHHHHSSTSNNITINHNTNPSPILEFYRNDFSRQQQQQNSQSEPHRRKSNVAQDFQSNNINNNNCFEYKTPIQKSTNLVSAALLLFTDMDLNDLYTMEEAIRTRINALTQSSG